MKLFFTIFLFLVITQSFAQGSFRTNVVSQQATYNTLHDITRLTDSAYVAIGDASIYDNSSGGNRYWGYIAELNAKGEKVNIINMEDSSQGNIVRNTLDKGFVAGGLLKGVVAIHKYTADLGLEWSKKYLLNDTRLIAGSALDIEPISDSEYMAVINFQLQLTLFESVYCLAKLDKQGNIIWCKTYSEPLVRLTSIKSAGDGNYILGGVYGYIINKGTPTAFPIEQGGALCKINSNGDILWEKQFTVPTTAGFWVPEQIRVLADGNIVTAGYCTDNQNQSTANTALSKFDSAGHLLWAKRTTSENSLTSLYLQHFIVDKDSGFFMTGYTYTGGGSFSQGFNLKTDSSGNLQWSKLYSSSHVFSNVVFAADSGYMLSGDEQRDNTTYGAVDKLTPDYFFCGESSDFGSLKDQAFTETIGGTITAYDTSVSVLDYVPVTNSEGTVVSLCSDSALPIHLLSFTAALQNNNKVTVEWKTSNEINADYFIVQRGNTSSFFEDLQRIRASGSSSVKIYTITDNSPLSGTSYYRLKQVDKDGKIVYSSIVPVITGSNGTVLIAPNPIHTVVNVKIQSSMVGTVTLQVVDLSGKPMLTRQVIVTRGSNLITLPATSLAQGSYILKLMAADGKMQTLKFIKY